MIKNIVKISQRNKFSECTELPVPEYPYPCIQQSRPSGAYRESWKPFLGQCNFNTVRTHCQSAWSEASNKPEHGDSAFLFLCISLSLYMYTYLPSAVPKDRTHRELATNFLRKLFPMRYQKREGRNTVSQPPALIKTHTRVSIFQTHLPAFAFPTDDFRFSIYNNSDCDKCKFNN